MPASTCAKIPDQPLAQYRVAYQPDQRHLKAVTPKQLFETPHRSPRPTGAAQPPLFPLDEVGN